ncbi:hypothetical protein T296_11370 [Pantoea agglomerans Eh318]|nr:hypothetical protein T296_11370 [Pantoea agglomerans Eh318]
MSMKSQTSETSGLICLTSKSVCEAVREYGFSEIGDILSFLDFICRPDLGISEIAYIRKKIDLCLRRYDDGRNYFIPLREFATELDCMIEMSIYRWSQAK